MKYFSFILIISLSIQFKVFGQKNNSLTSSEVKLFRQAYGEYWKKNYKLSLHLFDSLIEIDNSIRTNPIHCRAIGVKGLVFFDMGNLNNAQKAFEDAIECSSDSFYWYKHLGLVFYELKKFDSAEFAYKKVGTSNPKNHEYYYNLSKVKKAKGEHLEAIKFMNSCIHDCLNSYDLEGTCKNIFYLRAETYHIIEEDSLAQLDIRKHLEIYPSDSLAIKLNEEIMNCLSD